MIDDKDYLLIQYSRQNLSMIEVIKKDLIDWNRKRNLVTSIIKLCRVVQGEITEDLNYWKLKMNNPLLTSLT